MRTVGDILHVLPTRSDERLRPPAYIPGSGTESIGLAVGSMQRHTTDEGWQIFAGLQAAGYRLYGGELSRKETDVRKILQTNPATLVIQDKREWTGRTAGGPATFNPAETFRYTSCLGPRSDVFKVTILKDAQSQQQLHVEAAEEIGIHAWIIYYHPSIVSHLAPYVRPEHLIRTYHCLDRTLVPYVGYSRQFQTLFSGATGLAYPLRNRIVKHLSDLPGVTHLLHPGYGRRKCHTPQFLQTLARFRVAICTSSLYGYALRKIIEATACGCVVVTDLPSDEILPAIDGNLVRIDADIPLRELRGLLHELCESYDSERQNYFAMLAQDYYDYHAVGRRLAEDIERARVLY